MVIGPAVFVEPRANTRVGCVLQPCQLSVMPGNSAWCDALFTHLDNKGCLTGCVCRSFGLWLGSWCSRIVLVCCSVLVLLCCTKPSLSATIPVPLHNTQLGNPSLSLGGTYYTSTSIAPSLYVVTISPSLHIGGEYFQFVSVIVFTFYFTFVVSLPFVTHTVLVKSLYAR